MATKPKIILNKHIHWKMASMKINLAIFQPQKTPPKLSKTTISNTPFSKNILIKRKSFNLSIIAFILSQFSTNNNNNNAIAIDDKQLKRDDELERYIDSSLGFTLLTPSSYIKVDKAGATVLFEEESKGSNNIGVVVDSVRLTSLREFGTPQFVADKLIQAEKRKESTKDAKVVGVSERSGVGGIPVYEFEYIVDSTRGGMKRIFSAAFVSQKKLYLLNISHADKPESLLDSHTRMMLEQVLHSFDTITST